MKQTIKALTFREEGVEVNIISIIFWVNVSRVVIFILNHFQ